MGEPIFPLEVWTSQITQASIPANENALRVEVLEKPAIAIESAQPATPAEDDVYVIGAAPTGDQWAGFSEGDVAIYKEGTWLAFAPFEGWVKVVGGDLYTYDTGAWSAFTVPVVATPAAVVSITASTTLDLTHAGKFLDASHATVAIVLTVPPQASVVWEDGTQIEIRQGGAAAVSIAAGAGVTIQQPASQTLAIKEQYGAVALKRVAADTWALIGMLGDA